MDLLSSSRRTGVDSSPAETWSVVAAAGLGPHWYLEALPLRVRSALDRLVGGAEPVAPPDEGTLRAGARAGIWEVRRATHRTLELVARVRAPGEVVLTTKVLADRTGSLLEQTVRFRPRGVLGAAYLVADLPVRELTIDLVHRRTVAELHAAG